MTIIFFAKYIALIPILIAFLLRRAQRYPFPPIFTLFQIGDPIERWGIADERGKNKKDKKMVFSGRMYEII
jgi:hypothetical protein